jgi:muramidase (phage lysozyme)
VTLKSILDIEVKDDAFQRFLDKFKEFQDRARKAPPGFADIGKETEGTAVTMERLTALLAAHAEITSQIASHHEHARGQLEKQATIWGKITEHAKSTAGHLRSAAGFIARTGLGAGLGLAGAGVVGLGALFGLDRMAQAAALDRRTAMGLGTTFGGLRAFTLNFQRYGDPGALLAGVSEAMADPGRRQAFNYYGMSAQGDPVDKAIELLSHFRATALSTSPGMLGLMAEIAGGGQFGIDEQMMRRLKQTGTKEGIEEWALFLKHMKEDRPVFDKLSKAQQRSLRDLNDQLTRAGETVEFAFWRKLAQLAPHLEHISKKLSTDIAAWLDSITDADVDRWVANIKSFVTAIGNAASFINNLFGPFKPEWGQTRGSQHSKFELGTWSEVFRHLVPGSTLGGPAYIGPPQRLRGEPFGSPAATPAPPTPSAAPSSWWRRALGAINPISAAEAAPLLNLIGRTEGTDRGRGYNETLGYGRYTGGPVDLESMTIDQVYKLQQSMLAHGASSTAVGRYQFISSTLHELVAQAGLDPATTKFTGEVQDRLIAARIQWRLARARARGEDPMLELAQEFASIPDPRTGRSYYSGQRAGASVSEVAKVLGELAGRSQGLPSAQPKPTPLPEPKRRTPQVEVRNNTGGNAYISASQLAL